MNNGISGARRSGGCRNACSAGRLLSHFFAAATACLVALPVQAEEAETVVVPRAEDGVFDDRILFGQAAALEGPAAALGSGMALGISAAFAEINAQGGVAGRQLELLSYDDGYEPEQAIERTRQLINQDKVFALIGSVGTPTAAATQPIAMEAGVPFIGPFTGVGFLRNPELGNVVNIRASYDAETEAWMAMLVDQQRKRKIAILYQDDAFGRAGLAGARAALERRNMKFVAEGIYQRNTRAVKAALLEIRRTQPDAVVMVGAYSPIAEFIKTARSIDFNPTFVNISFVGSDALAEELGEAGADVVISQVVPFPWDTANPLVAAYQAALAAHDEAAEPGFVSFEGYLAGRLAAAALEATGAAPTRARFLETIWTTGSFEIDGMTLTFGPDDNQGLDDVFMTEIQPDGSFRSLAGPES